MDQIEVKKQFTITVLGGEQDGITTVNSGPMVATIIPQNKFVAIRKNDTISEMLGINYAKGTIYFQFGHKRDGKDPSTIHGLLYVGLSDEAEYRCNEDHIYKEEAWTPEFTIVISVSGKDPIFQSNIGYLESAFYDDVKSEGRWGLMNKKAPAGQKSIDIFIQSNLKSNYISNIRNILNITTQIAFQPKLLTDGIPDIRKNDKYKFGIKSQNPEHNTLIHKVRGKPDYFYMAEVYSEDGESFSLVEGHCIRASKKGEIKPWSPWQIQYDYRVTKFLGESEDPLLYTIVSPIIDVQSPSRLIKIVLGADSGPNYVIHLNTGDTLKDWKEKQRPKTRKSKRNLNEEVFQEVTNTNDIDSSIKLSPSEVPSPNQVELFEGEFYASFNLNSK